MFPGRFPRYYPVVKRDVSELETSESPKLISGIRSDNRSGKDQLPYTENFLELTILRVILLPSCTGHNTSTAGSYR